MENNKKQLRKAILTTRNQMDEKGQLVQSRANTDAILALPLYQDAKQILLYASYGSEADTYELLKYSLAEGKEVYLPKVVVSDDSEEMYFYKVTLQDDLCSGYKGIPEPVGDTELFCYHSGKPVLMIMPGVVFDQEHNRIGYGKGFYDRFLSRNPELISSTVAIGFSCQLVSEIQADALDIKPAGLILSGKVIGGFLYD